MLLPLLFALTLVGCASTVGAPERAVGLARFMVAPSPAILSHPRKVTVDESLLAMRQRGAVVPLTDAFDSVREVAALLGSIRDSAPSLGHGVVGVVRPDAPDANRRAADTPVLFVWPTWKVSYQRLPPRFEFVRLELGVIAKVIPHGQVMDGHGPIALRTASWETQCHRYAADGRYLPVRQWLADDAAQWRQALADVREACGRQIGMAFEQSVAMLSRSPQPVE